MSSLSTHFATLVWCMLCYYVYAHIFLFLNMQLPNIRVTTSKFNPNPYVGSLSRSYYFFFFFFWEGGPTNLKYSRIHRLYDRKKCHVDTFYEYWLNNFSIIFLVVFGLRYLYLLKAHNIKSELLMSLFGYKRTICDYTAVSSGGPLVAVDS